MPYFVIVSKSYAVDNSFFIGVDAASKQEMRGKTLRVAVFQFPPAIIINGGVNGSHSYTGTSIDILDYVSKALDVNYRYVPAKKSDLKKFGLAGAQIKMILNDEVDIAAFGLLQSPEKNRLVDLSVPVMMKPYRLVIPWPEEKRVGRKDMLAPVRPFSLQVWLWLGTCAVVMMLFFSLLSALYRKYVNPNEINTSPQEQRPYFLLTMDVGYSCMFLLSHLTNHRFSMGVHLRCHPGFIAVGVWILMTVVLANTYAAFLLSFLSVEKFEPVINSISELAYSNDVQLTVQAHSELAERFLNATNGTEKRLGDSLRSNPTNLIPDADRKKVKQKLLSGKYAYLFDLFNYGLIDATYRENGNKCRFTLAKEPVPAFFPASFGLAKNGPSTKVINQLIQEQIDLGLMATYVQKYTPNIDQCILDNQKGSATDKSLSLLDMSSAFVVLGLGVGLALIAFLVEVVYKAISNKK